MASDPNDKLRAAARERLGPFYDEARWPDERSAAAATSERDALVASLAGRVTTTALGSKLYTGTLSRGCRACIAGTWSCLYVTSWCQATCFYCPKSIEYRTGGSDYLPNAEGVEFPSAELYAEYAALTGIESVGMSGGEPFGALDRVEEVTRAVKDRTAGAAHVYVYTNGGLVTRPRLEGLRDAGVDEIRFDISAFDYDVSKVALARDVIGTVSVEIPAVPEDESRLARVIPTLEDIGVDHLNLHQLDVTVDNAAAFIRRGYTFLHQRETAVLESEMTALRVFVEALDAGRRLPINFCCPTYQVRFQSRRTLRRGALLARRPHEEVTEPGFLRRLSIVGAPEALATIVRRLGAAGRDDFVVDSAGGSIHLTLAAFAGVDLGDARLQVVYSRVDLASHDAGEGWRPVWQGPGGGLWARRRPAVEALLTAPAIRDAYLGMLRDGWDEPAAFRRMQAAPMTTADSLRTTMAEWALVRELRSGEMIPSGLGEIA